MFRKILFTIGLVEVLAPERFIEIAEGIALENPDECEMKSWVVPVARAEGLLFLGLAWRGGTSYSAFKQLLGGIGLLAVLYPRLFVDSAAEVAYTDADRCTWKAWCYPLTRLVGILYVAIALNERRKR